MFVRIIKDRLDAIKNKQRKKKLTNTRIKILKDNGYSMEEISRVVGLSESTIRLILKSQ